MKGIVDQRINLQFVNQRKTFTVKEAIAIPWLEGLKEWWNSLTGLQKGLVVLAVIGGGVGGYEAYRRLRK